MESQLVDATLIVMIIAGLALIGLGVPRPRNKPLLRTIDRSKFDNSVVNNIRYQIVPYVISASMLPRTFEYTIYRFFCYIRSFLAGLVGLGIAPPFLVYLSKVAQQGTHLNESSLQIPVGLNYMAIASAILLLAISIYSSQTSLDKRAVLADSCSAEFRGHYAKLLSIVSEPDCRSKLDGLSNEIATNVQRHIAEKAWTFKDVIAPGIEKRTEELTDDLLARIKEPPVSIQQKEK
jgi:hypothetical protein